jgi:mono/diheme cytochrome c family protein
LTFPKSGTILIDFFGGDSVTLALALVALFAPQTPPGPAPKEADRFRAEIHPILARHCLECHGEEKPKGQFRLGELDPGFPGKEAEDRWRRVLEQLEADAMPPKKKARLAEADVRQLTEWIGTRLARAAAARRAALGRVVLRRLNRLEYANTLRDLLGVEVDLKEVLALDSSMDGFDNVGSALHLSSFALERYLEAADKALSLAIVNRSAPPSTRKRYTLRESHQVLRADEPAFRVIEDTVVCLTSVHWHRVWLPHFWPQDGGFYRFRISACGYQSAGKPITFEVTGGPGGVDFFDAPADTPREFEFIAYKEPHTSLGLLPYGMGAPAAVKASGVEKYPGPGLAVQWVEVEGPISESWPPESHRRIFGDLPLRPLPSRRERLETVSEHPEADAESILRRFARRAFRRPVSDRELRPILELVHSRLAEKDSFEQAVRVGLSAILMSTNFLFLDEKPGRLDDFALASRLSYFLWSSMPDEELFRLAESGTLGEPAVLQGQVDRMLENPKASALTRNFCGQWLGLREIDFTAPNHIAYPEYDEMLKHSMVRETELFFAELLKDDLPVTDLVASDFALLNGRLARHYGIPGVEGLWEFRKVTLPPGSHRGGVITMASVMKVTANGTSTSPVTRGAWVLDRILGTPPPKPPPGVSALEPDIRGATTIREQLAKHRTIETCAACHAQIDPPGFALESFDVIGGWRDFYRLASWAKGAKPIPGKAYLEGPKVDPTGELRDGRKFRDIDEFRELLLREKDQITRALAGRLVTYATGGSPEAMDRPELLAIVERVREKHYGLRTLVHEIVESRMFREK